jgi:putative hydrolase of the HAD superfamily
MIKAIIFDWGGVLIDNPILGLISYCSKYLNASEEEFDRVLHKFRPDFQKGIISEHVFWERACSELGVPKPNVKSLWGDAFKSVYSEKKEVFSLAYSLRENGYRIGFLSNTEVPPMNYFHEKGYNIFDAAIFSCVVGITKPESGIYEITLNMFSVRPREAIFIDDKEENIKGAKEVGINTILFKSPEQLKMELVNFSIKI